MLILGILLFQIQTGALSYTPDSTYGLFLVIVSFQIITLGKTPFGDLRRSWALIIIGIFTASMGMLACFIPGYFSMLIRLLVGFILLTGGISLLGQFFLSKDKARAWIKIPGIIQHLTIACGLVYVISILAGIITLFPGITTNSQTAVILIAYGISFFYLSWCIHGLNRDYISEEVDKQEISTDSGGSLSLFREISLPLSFALLIMLGVLLVLLGILLFPVNLGLIPFSPDGQLGLLLVIVAIQIMAQGNTPMGQFKRSWLLVIVGMIFVALGIVSCIVPGILSGVISILVGSLNLFGGIWLLFKRFVQSLEEPQPEKIPNLPIIKSLTYTQILLNVVAILFGLSTLIVGLLSGFLVAGILIINGILLFVLVFILHKLD